MGRVVRPSAGNVARAARFTHPSPPRDVRLPARGGGLRAPGAVAPEGTAVDGRAGRRALRRRAGVRAEHRAGPDQPVARRHGRRRQGVRHARARPAHRRDADVAQDRQGSQPGRQRPRRDARGGDRHHRDGGRLARDAPGAREPRGPARRALGARHRRRDGTPRPRRASSSRSSPPRPSASGRAWGSPWSSGWWRGSAAPSWSRAPRGREPRPDPAAGRRAGEDGPLMPRDQVTVLERPEVAREARPGATGGGAVVKRHALPADGRPVTVGRGRGHRARQPRGVAPSRGVERGGRSRHPRSRR